MCYGRHTGYGGYGDAARGGRQVLLDQKTMKDEVRTWIRLEDGTISAPVSLNATYGQDRYGPVLRKASQVQTSGSPICHDQSAVLLVIYMWLPILCLLYWRRG